MTIRTYKINYNFDLDILFKGMQSCPYNEDEKSGYFIDSFINNQIEGRFVLKRIFSEESISPIDGEIQLNEIIQFEVFHFKIFHDNKILMLYNSPRSTSIFFTSINSLFDFSISIEKCDLNLLNFIENVKLKTDINEVIYLELCNISFSNLTKGKVIISGNENVIPYIEKATFHSTNYEINRLGLKIIFNDKPIRLDITNTGSYRVADSYAHFVLPKISEAILDYFE